MLDVQDVFAGYGKLHILNGVSMQVEKGQITVIVGPNGSGKSTLLKTISGLTTLYDGAISFEDREIARLPAHVIAKMGLAYLPQTESVFTQLTVAENIKMAAYTVPASEFQMNLKGALQMFPVLSNYMATKVQNLSGGERQMVAMTMALMRRPKLIMLDEPTGNLSPKLAAEVLKNTRSLAKDSGMAVVLVEQNAKRALEIGDNALLMVGGKKVFDGSARDLLAHQELAKMYLGLKTAQAG